MEEKMTSEPLLKCKRCYGRGFFLKQGGFTKADRVDCHKCGGCGKVHEYKTKNKRKVYKYYYSKEGMTE